jgi:hemoglobin-like flavoprotein
MTTPRQIELVRESFRQVDPSDAGEAFYDTLFKLNPATRRLFSGDIAIQSRKLVDMLGAIVQALDAPERLHALFRVMGERHLGYGVVEDQYDDVGAALLQTLHAAFGEAFTEELEAAWASVYADLAECMIAAGRRT